MEPTGVRVALRIWVALVLLFLFVPILLIVVYSFDPATVESWPIQGFTMHWFSVAWHDSGVRTAFLLSVKVGLLATGIRSEEHTSELQSRENLVCRLLLEK